MVIFAGGSVVVAVALALAIRKVVPAIAERQFEELADGLRVVYELLFALLLAFVIASVLDKFSEAESTVGSEATALSQMVRSSRSRSMRRCGSTAGLACTWTRPSTMSGR